MESINETLHIAVKKAILEAWITTVLIKSVLSLSQRQTSEIAVDFSKCTAILLPR